MAQQRHDSTGELRAAHLFRGLGQAKHTLRISTGGTFLRVALGVVYMYLIFISYQLLGAAGPVFISILFLVAFFVPFLYQAITLVLDKRRAQEENHKVADESRQQG